MYAESLGQLGVRLRYLIAFLIALALLWYFRPSLSQLTAPIIWAAFMIGVIALLYSWSKKGTVGSILFLLGVVIIVVVVGLSILHLLE